MNEVVVDESTNDASPAVAGIHVGLRVEQQSHDLRLTLAGGDASIEVNAVDVHCRSEQLLHPAASVFIHGSYSTVNIFTSHSFDRDSMGQI
jgi:hypothetical protein